MRRIIGWFIKALKLMHHPRLFVYIVFKHITDSYGMLLFLVKRKLRYNGRIHDDLLQKFEWRHVIELKGWISEDKYLTLCKNIFEQNLNRLKSRGMTKVCFVMYMDTSWSCGDLYRLLDKDKRFQVCILVSPSPNLDQPFEKIKEFCVNKGYRTYEIQDWGGWRDSDIFIYLNPYILPPKEVNIDHRRLSELCMIIPYAIFQGDGDDEHLEGDINGQSRGLWRYYCYTDDSFQYGLKHNSLSPVNMKLSGYPKMDRMYDEIKDPPEWHGGGKWRILFAPSMVWKYSVFIDTWKTMLEIAEEEGEISWIFRPHPMLGASLVNTHQLENIKEYEEYIERWRELPNASVQIGGDYIDTFKTSDAMIADGTTFLTNYQYVHKPLLFLRGGKDHNLSPYGRELYDCLYICDGDYKNEVRRFIREVVKQGKDVMRQRREEFFDRNLDYKKRNGVMASEYIYEDLCKSIYGNVETKED